MLAQKLNRYFSTTYIVAGRRTAMGGFQSKLSKLRASELGAAAINGAVNDVNGLQKDEVDEVIMGTVCQAGQGQNPARQAALGAEIDIKVPCTTINKVCSSGLKSVMYGSMSVQLGLSNVVVAGGFESMSNVPYYINNHRRGHAFGNQQLIDGLAYDGLTDVYNNIAMGLCAEKTAEDYEITRQLQDDYAIMSYERAIHSIKNNLYRSEITPVIIDNKKQEVFQVDEEHAKFVKEKIPLIRPAFSKNGTITAGNASKLNDAGCAVILMSESAVQKYGVKPLAKIVSYADAEVQPMDFCVAPSSACQKALSLANMDINQIEYHEINEAFAVTTLVNAKLQDLDIKRVNVNGGAIAMGHPIGMSGTRVLLSLMTVLQQNNGKYGMVSLCNGGGGASAMIIENMV